MSGDYVVVAADAAGREMVLEVDPWCTGAQIEGSWYVVESKGKTVNLSSTFFVSVIFMKKEEYLGIKQGQGDKG